ncbi:hypothetical protein C0995_004980 [Termitomyces sp. Mi166|nr:hypothetical protein C0995_004980 [Termitomyces sp. Mi166\
MLERLLRAAGVQGMAEHGGHAESINVQNAALRASVTSSYLADAQLASFLLVQILSMLASLSSALSSFSAKEALPPPNYHHFSVFLSVLTLLCMRVPTGSTLSYAYV